MEESDIPTAVQSKMARGVLDWSIRKAAKETGVAFNTIKRLENNEPVREDSRQRLCAAYQAAGIVFIGKDGARWSS